VLENTDAPNKKATKVAPAVLGSGKISMTLGKKPGINMNIGGIKKLSAAPIKMSLATQVFQGCCIFVMLYLALIPGFTLICTEECLGNGGTK
jgi:hypothetical protein